MSLQPIYGLDWAQKLGLAVVADDPPDAIYRVDSVTGDDDLDGAGESWTRPFATIQAAVNKARYEADGATIDSAKNHRARVEVASGHYNEQVLFSGYNIDIVGVGPTVPGKDYGVSINYDGAIAATAVVGFSGSGITLKNLHIYCAEAIPALYIAGGDNNRIENVVIEGDGTNCTYGIQADSMKGSRIEGVVMTGFATAGIYVAGGANHYFINGWIRNCLIHSATANVTGILVDNTVTAYGAMLDRNFITLTSGASCKGVDVNATGGLLVTDNYVSVPSSATAIEHAGGEQFLMGNHTAAGTTNVDPDPAAG